jgi:ribosomal protein L11 methyltransferase
MDYIELNCLLQPGTHVPDLLIAQLADLGFESFTEEDDGIRAYIPANGFTLEIETKLASGDLKDLLKSYKSNLIKDQNWNAVWESAYEPVMIDNRCLIRAPFHAANPAIPYEIIIEPKMSFGTAHHETTRLMIQYLLDLSVKGKKVLDMGSGTGVLAILAALKGAGPVTAIDNEEWAYNNAIENARNNNQEEILVLLGDASLLRNQHYDFVLANINRNILLNDIPEYRKCLSVGGSLIMSGFYEEDLALISTKAFEFGMELISNKSDNHWTAASFVVKK